MEKKQLAEQSSAEGQTRSSASHDKIPVGVLDVSNVQESALCMSCFRPFCDLRCKGVICRFL